MVNITKPDNAVLAAGKPVKEELIAKTITNLTPGAALARDTDDEHCKAAAATDDFGGFADISHKVDIGDTYAVDDAVIALHGAGNFVAGILDQNQAITKNNLLELADDGRLRAVTTGRVVAKAAETLSSGAAEYPRILVKSLE